ncbi:hypothetical protein PG994_000728 [Apiospora phragmitis]|uniref:Uncharacterized protein n=1 Tax=Apiospora phragmitis TaxID=2905665 RepID=A0ABR1X704_9PEZI
MSQISFGVEIETAIDCKFDLTLNAEPKRQKRSAPAGLYIAEILREEHGIACSKSDGDGKDYKICQTEFDITLEHGQYDEKPNETPNGKPPVAAPLELKTAVMVDNGEWRTTLANIDLVLQGNLAQRASRKFGALYYTNTHILYPTRTTLPDFPVKEARLIVFATFVFKEAMDKLMPGMIRHTIWSQKWGWEKNTYAMDNTHKDYETILDLHRELLCIDKNKKGGKDEARNFKWNLSGGKSKTGLQWKTIEFRPIPPLVSRGQLSTWVDFIFSFVRAATSINEDDLTKAEDVGRIYELYGLKNELNEVEVENLLEFIKPHAKGVEDFEKFGSNLEGIRKKVEEFFDPLLPKPLHAKEETKKT